MEDAGIVLVEDAPALLRSEKASRLVIIDRYFLPLVSVPVGRRDVERLIRCSGDPSGKSSCARFLRVNTISVALRLAESFRAVSMCSLCLDKPVPWAAVPWNDDGVLWGFFAERLS